MDRTGQHDSRTNPVEIVKVNVKIDAGVWCWQIEFSELLLTWRAWVPSWAGMEPGSSILAPQTLEEESGGPDGARDRPF